MKHLKMTLMLFSLFAVLQCSEDDGCKKSATCNLEPNSGACLAAFPRYYYDKTEKRCKEFVWGGCGGTVPFETMAECENSCHCE